jgi:hypothetical protein
MNYLNGVLAKGGHGHGNHSTITIKNVNPLPSKDQKKIEVNNSPWVFPGRVKGVDCFCGAITQ